MVNYNTSELRKNGVDVSNIKQEARGKDWWKLITKNKIGYTYWQLYWTTGIADWIKKNMIKRGETLPPKHWEWRHIESTKTLRQAKELFNN